MPALVSIGCATAPPSHVPETDVEGDRLLISALPPIRERVHAYVELERAECHHAGPDGIVRMPCLRSSDESTCRPEVMDKLPPLPPLPSVDLQRCSEWGYLLLKDVNRRGCLEGGARPNITVPLENADCEGRFPVFSAYVFLMSRWPGETDFEVRPEELVSLQERVQWRLDARRAREAREAAGCPSSDALKMGRALCEAQTAPEFRTSCAVENERPLCWALREREHVRLSQMRDVGSNACTTFVLSELERTEGLPGVQWPSDPAAIGEACRRISPRTFELLDAGVRNQR